MLTLYAEHQNGSRTKLGRFATLRDCTFHADTLEETSPAKVEGADLVAVEDYTGKEWTEAPVVVNGVPTMHWEG